MSGLTINELTYVNIYKNVSITLLKYDFYELLKVVRLQYTGEMGNWCQIYCIYIHCESKNCKVVQQHNLGDVANSIPHCVQKLHSRNSERIIKIDLRLTKL